MSVNQPPGGNGQDPKRLDPKRPDFAPSSARNELNPARPAPAGAQSTAPSGQPPQTGVPPRPIPAAMPEKHPMLRQQPPQSPIAPAVTSAPAKPASAASQTPIPPRPSAPAPQASAPQSSPRPAMPKSAPQQPRYSAPSSAATSPQNPPTPAVSVPLPTQNAVRRKIGRAHV